MKPVFTKALASLLILSLLYPVLAVSAQSFTITVSSPAQVNQGGLVTISGKLSKDSGGVSNALVSIVVKNPSGSDIGEGSYRSIVKTGVNGSYNDSYRLPAGAPLGTYSVSVTASPGGVITTASTSFTVTTASTSFNFAVSVSPSNATIIQGQNATYSVVITLTGEGTQPVNLTVSGLPSGATATFSVSSGSPPFTSTMTLATSLMTAAGNYTITILAAGGGSIRSTATTLTVSAVPASLDIKTQKGGAGAGVSGGEFSPGDTVMLTVTLTKAGRGIADTMVAVQMNGPDGNPITTQSLTTGQDGSASMNVSLSITASTGVYNVTASATYAGNLLKDYVTFTVKQNKPSLTISSVTPCDASGNSQTSFKIGSLAGFKVVIVNKGAAGAALVTINVYDTSGATLGIGSFQGSVSPGSSTYIISLVTSADAAKGTATVFVNTFTDWPSRGGTPFTPESSTTLTFV